MKRKANSEELLYNDTSTNGHAVVSGFANAMIDTLSEYDIVSSPDPTSSVSILQDPELPRFAAHFPDVESTGTKLGDAKLDTT